MLKYLILIICLLGGNFSYADTYSVNEIVEAIGQAENSIKYPYGIKSIDTKGNVEYARKICRNSVINNYKRYVKNGKKGDFLSFMRDRFCPLSDSKLNRYWVDNVKYWLVKARKEIR